VCLITSLVRLGEGTRLADACVGGILLGDTVPFFRSTNCVLCFALTCQPPDRG
jgi:hypothetical protein